MPRIEARLSRMGLELPAVFAAPGGLELPFDLVHIAGDTAYVSGHGPIDGATPLMLGKVGGQLTLEDGREAARLTAPSILASLKAELHPRSAIGAAELPFDIPVEIEAVVKVGPPRDP